MTVNTQFSPSAAGPAIRGLTKTKAEQLNQIVRLVADEAGTDTASIWGPDQDMYSVAFRRAIWWMMRNGYGMTLENIAKNFNSHNGGHFNHTSVMTALRDVDNEKGLEWNEQKQKWVDPESGAPYSKVRLREALQVVAEIWNKQNPQNPLRTWTKLQ